MMTAVKRTLQQERRAKGLCPRCGEEAAPYALCKKHRDAAFMDRVLNRCARENVFKREKIKGKIWWSLGSTPNADVDFGPDLKPGDRRRLPRIGRVPVDVEAEVIKIVKAAGKSGITIEEVLAAWGKLRETRSAGTIASNMAAVIAAQHKRDAKAAKRMRLSGLRGLHAQGACP